MTQESSPVAERVFKCVPLNPSWTIAGTKLDLKAIYRRPRRRVGEYDEIIQERGEDGLPLYDLTGPLPLRRHSDWAAKGYEYVTLADRDSLTKVAGSLRADGHNPAEFDQHPVLGPWNPKLYLATADKIDRAKVSKLRALVEKLGSEAVLDVRRATDPTFNLPPELQNIPPGGPAKQLRADKASAVKPGEITDRAGYDQAIADGRLAEIPPVGSSAAKRISAQKGAETKRRNAAAAGKADA